MSTKASSTDGWINKAVAAAKKHPALSVPEAMLIGGLSKKQISVDAVEHGRNLHQQMYTGVGKQQDSKWELLR